MEVNEKIKSVILIMMLTVMLGITGCGKEKPVLVQVAKEAATDEAGKAENSTDMDVKTDNKTEQEPAAGANGLCYVHICGAVMEPGVYEVPAGSRVYEVIERAGGFTAEASTDYRNQAGIVTDGEQIKILTVQEAVEVSTQEIQGEDKSVPAVSNLVNINTAEEAVLCTLPGIGSGKAASIITYRQEQGAFTKIEDILKVDGIKNGVYTKLKDRITVS